LPQLINTNSLLVSEIYSLLAFSLALCGVFLYPGFHPRYLITLFKTYASLGYGSFSGFVCFG
jgi:hypothetical protein